ncbi:AraC family transcriptional regulator [Paenibacillus baekrokdamisoli]|uniref:AraC family transcriptional regulator n=1 Tax=Paenibacillus baekrokdamisoli TaxID=1712516 RepID=A0A3G9J7P5_9BACL|nr:AraC family transcriptional regulator [Paenibacillus baekrokdamisoli]MBB3073423.1 AraC family transcriptional regulator [Paenibacillus baekrokdamisoli]BBH24355.1 AraC family transcriptional regulator [Paenibacillus baekrokdamisoli]
MRSDLIQAFDALFDYIEDHITEKLTLEVLADSVNISKYHLHRLIKSVSGQPLGEYVRARKLARSFEQLIHSSWKIIEISEHYAFEHEHTYIRAFKKAFDITPLQYRKHGVGNVKITEKMSTSMITRLQEGYIFQPFYVRRSSMKLVGRRSVIRYIDNELFHEANTKGNDFFENEWHKINNRICPNVYIGLTREIDPSYSTYLPSAEVRSLEQGSEGLDWDELPANQYAVFRYVGDFHPSRITIDHLDQIWTFIDDYWQHHSGYSKAEAYYFESIDSSLAREDYGEMDIYIPIRQNVNGAEPPRTESLHYNSPLAEYEEGISPSE